MLGLPYTIQEIAQAGVATDLFQGLWPAPTLRYLSFDTRTIAHGSETIFVALKTPNRDGHDFLREAYEKGVRNFIVEKKLPWKSVNYLITDDSLSFLQRWAFRHRLRFSYPVVAITGSNGKTTVKEWAATLMEEDFRIVKSPMSYNSQLGVAVSLLHLHPRADLALIEAGISQTGEMEALAAMIQPDIGVFTHLGDAHASGFSSKEEKLIEKLTLFEQAKKILICSDEEEVLQLHPGLPWMAVGFREEDDVSFELNLTSPGPGYPTELNEPLILSVEDDGSFHTIGLNRGSSADNENSLLAILIARYFEVAWETIKRRITLLTPIEMRTEIITDHPQITIINDAYNSDLDSIRNALERLRSIGSQPGRIIVLTDISHQGEQQEQVQREVYEEAIRIAGGPDDVFLIGPVFSRMYPNRAFDNTDTLIRSISPADWFDRVVLLKGARIFQLEKLIPWLQRKPNATFFRINLNRLSENYRYLKSLIPNRCKTMAVVKAASYGSGTWEIAQHLTKEGVDYLAVAYPSEGIELREAGLDLPIMVMNPDPDSVQVLIRYDLEPEIGHFRLLDKYLDASRLEGTERMNIHLKLETGMSRLGFQTHELKALAVRVMQHPDLRVISVMSHLGSADDPSQEPFTLQQAAAFTEMANTLQELLGIQPFRHLINTSGILHYPDLAFDMVRMGIGLYGLDPTLEEAAGGKLQEIGSLHAFITKVSEFKAGSSVGYGRADVLTRDSRIAVVPVGYADGIFRSLGRGNISLLVREKPAPTVGHICMDMLMLDVTGIPEVRAGDEVVLFGRQGGAFQSVNALASAAGTIPYEILVRISPRVRRIFDQE